MVTNCERNECKAGLHSTADLLAENERLRVALACANAALTTELKAWNSLWNEKRALEAELAASREQAAAAERTLANATYLHKQLIEQANARTAAVERERYDLQGDMFRMEQVLKARLANRIRALSERDEELAAALKALEHSARTREAAERERDEARSLGLEAARLNTEMLAQLAAAEREVTKLKEERDGLASRLMTAAGNVKRQQEEKFAANREVSKLRELLARWEKGYNHAVADATRAALASPSMPAGEVTDCCPNGGPCVYAGGRDTKKPSCKDCGANDAKACPACGAFTCDGCAENADESCCPAPTIPTSEEP